MKRFVRRFFFILSSRLLRFVEFFNPRLYMRVYLSVLSIVGVKLSGVPRYISSLAVFDDFSLVSIGDRSVVSKYVTFLTHDYSITTALHFLGEPLVADVAVIKPIVIGNNVFIGMGVFITPGVEIGDNVIVGAGSVVRGKIPSNSVVVGNPCVVIDSLSEKALSWKGRLGITGCRVDPI